MASQMSIVVFFIALVHYGSSTNINCGNFCLFTWQPLCGSDGNTYSNACELKKMNCSLGGSLTKVGNGVCGLDLSKRVVPGGLCDIACPEDDYSPVCGSDWRTYNNDCELMKFSCNTGGTIIPVSHGACKIFPGRRASNSKAASCDFICTDDYSPMCGSDGKTYSNACELTRQSCQTDGAVIMASPGPCAALASKREAEAAGDGVASIDCHFQCPLGYYAPVCGSDGKTYNNGCELSWQKCRTAGAVHAVSHGPCGVVASTSDMAVSKRDDCPSICPFNYDPVCGSDGKTYSNTCALVVNACQSGIFITVAHHDACDMNVSKRDDCPSICPFNYDPVCGSDGKTYSNTCALVVNACQSGIFITVAHHDACDMAVSKRDDCPSVCPFNYNPVCGSDGKTYSNHCALVVNACQSGIFITVAHHDACDMAVSKRDDCPSICIAVYSPVCGSDGKTYSNSCRLSVQACQSGTTITVAHTGRCG